MTTPRRLPWPTRAVGALLGVLGARVNQGGSYRRNNIMPHCLMFETSAKAE
ncbi:hypothetical protein ACVDG5_014790 [Mesorhizobium sp. ORM6]